MGDPVRVTLAYRQGWRRKTVMETTNNVKSVVVDFEGRDIRIDGYGARVNDVEPKSIVITEDENE